MSIDLLSLTAHKIYGPKGVGALYVRVEGPARAPRRRMIDGGGHERGMRSGTLNVPGIVGLGKACELVRDEHGRRGAARPRGCASGCARGSSTQLDEVYLNGHPTHRLPGNLNVSFAFVEGESLLMGLNGSVHPIAVAASPPPIAVSSGSACTSATLEPSYVLKALGVGDDLAHTSIRFGLGRFNTDGGGRLRRRAGGARGAPAARPVAALRDGEGRHRSEDRRSGSATERAPGRTDDGIQRQGTRPLLEPAQRRLASPKDEPNVGTGIVGAPECGDVMKLQLKISDDGVIEDARFKTFGCGSAIASSSYVTELVKGKTVDEVMQIKNTQIVEELSLPPVKIHCSVLAEDGIKAAIADWKKRKRRQAAEPRRRRRTVSAPWRSIDLMTDQAAAQDPAACWRREKESPTAACA